MIFQILSQRICKDDLDNFIVNISISAFERLTTLTVKFILVYSKNIFKLKIMRKFFVLILFLLF